MNQAMSEKQKFNFTLNGSSVEVSAYPFSRLLDVIREDCKLTGTKEGCGEGECGACSIIMDGKLVNSCLIPAVQVQGAKIETIEGIGSQEKLSKIQKSFLECGGAQCGICTPGMVIATHALLAQNSKPTLAEIKEALAGNLCRCTGYKRIFESVVEASR